MLLVLLAVMGLQEIPTMAHVDGFTVNDKDTVSREGGKPLCNADVTLAHSDPDILDIHLSLNLVLICGNGAEPGVFDNVKGNGFYTLGDSGSTGGRLRVMSGRYTKLASDPSRVIVVQAVSGPIQGDVYNLDFVQIDGCEINGRYSPQGSPDDKQSLTGRTNCNDPSCTV